MQNKTKGGNISDSGTFTTKEKICVTGKNEI
jgi:hypothetical protein